MGVILVDRVIGFLHGGSLLSTGFEPDSNESGPENRRSTSNGDLVTLVAHVKRDIERNGRKNCSVLDYKARIHDAVSAGGHRDHYTGEALNWGLISRFRN